MKLRGQHDPAGGDGYIPGAWDEVRAAFLDGHITDEAYECLHRTLAQLDEVPERKAMLPYAYTKSDRDDPRWYENQHPLQSDTTTATVWTLHLNVRPEALGAVLNAMAEAPETTGEYTYEGDSWVEWGTPTADLDDQHLAVYFRSKPEDAAILGASLATQASNAARTSLTGYDVLTLPLPHHVSTSGDYAEQVHA
jgi:hypothetical protein